MAGAVDEAEVPVEHFRAGVPPAVAPRVNRHSGAFQIERGAGGPAEDFRLPVEAVAAGIEAELGDHQRPVAGDVVQAFHVAPECRLVFQIDVEGGEIRVFRLQIFGARVVRVGEQQLRREFPAQGDQLARSPRRTFTGPIQRTRSAGISLPT